MPVFPFILINVYMQFTGVFYDMLQVLDLPVQHKQRCHCPLDGDVLRIARESVATPDEGDVLRVAAELPPAGEILRITALVLSPVGCVVVVAWYCGLLLLLLSLS